MSKKEIFIETEANKIIRKNKNKIKKIIHISDIHLRRNSPERDEEFRQVFNNLNKELKKLKLSEKDSLIVLTGDIFDEPNSSGNSSKLFIELYKMLSSHVPTITICGNHDVTNNLKDNISALAEASESKHKNYILSKRGQYQYSNILFSYTDHVDSKVYNTKGDNKKLTKICLYHGIVEHDELKDFLRSDTLLKLKDFEMYHDWCLFGDVHKNYFLSDKSHYAGSLIQQKISEDFDKGFIFLDLEKKERKFIKVHNNYGMLKLIIDKDGKTNYNSKKKYPKNLKLEIINKTGNLEKGKKLEEMIKKKYNIIKYNIINDVETDLNIEFVHEGIITNVTDIKTKEAIFNLLYTQIKQNNDLDKETDKHLEKALKDIITDNYHEIKLRDIILNKLSFKNLMGYSSGNIDFKKFKGIVQLSAPNNAGKSSIYLALLYALFGQITKTTSKSAVVRNGQTTYHTDVELSINNIDYKIIREGRIRNSKKEYEEVNVHEECWIYENGINISGKNLKDNKKKIHEIICPYEDFLKLIILNAGTESFMDMDDKKRIDILKSMGGLDMLSSISKRANSLKGSAGQSKNPLNNLMKRFKEFGKDYSEIINSIKNKLEEENIKIKDKVNDINEFNKKIKDIEKIINLKESELEKIENNEIENINFKEINKNIIDNKNKLNILNNDIEKINNNIIQYGDIEKDIYTIDNKRENKFELLNEKLEKISKKFINNKDDINKLKIDLKNNKKELINQNKIIKKIILPNIKNSPEIVEKNYNNYRDNIEKVNKINYELKNLNICKKENQEDIKLLSKYKFDSNCEYCKKNRQISGLERMENRKKNIDLNILKKNKEIKNLNEWIFNNKSYEEDKLLFEKYLEKKRNLDNINDYLKCIKENIENIKRRIDKYNKDLKFDKKLNIEHSKILREIKEFTIFSKYRELLNIKNKLSCKKEEKNNIEIIIKQLSDKIVRYNESEEELNKSNILKKEIENTKIILYDKKEQFTKLQKEKELLIKKRSGLEANLDEIMAANKEYDKLKKDTVIYKMIEDCINNKKFISKILKEKVLNKLESMVNLFMKELNLDPIKIALSGKSRAQYVNIYDRNTKKLKVMSGRYENYILNIIFSICITKLNKSFKPTFLILDEALDSTHTDNIPRVLKLINKIQNSGNYKFILLISHNEDIQKYSSQKLNIKRLEDGSRIINAT